jgi:hypothetical protein
VGVGGISGVAARIDIVFSAQMRTEIKIKRIGSKLDSIKHATFNVASPLPVTAPGGMRIAAVAPLD